MWLVSWPVALESSEIVNLILSVVGVLTLLAVVLVAIIQHRFSVIEYNIETHTSVVSPSHFPTDEIRIYYKDNQVDDLYISKIWIANAGKEEIRTEDFEEPIEIRFEKPHQVLDYHINDRIPESLKPKFITQKNTIRLRPLLLNPGDAVCFTMLSTSSEKPQLRGRVAKVSKFRQLDSTPLKDQIKLGLEAFSLGGFAALTTFGLIHLFSIDFEGPVTFQMGLVLLAPIPLMFGFASGYHYIVKALQPKRLQYRQRIKK